MQDSTSVLLAFCSIYDFALLTSIPFDTMAVSYSQSAIEKFFIALRNFGKYDIFNIRKSRSIFFISFFFF